ncbi:MAG TPA: aminopeptidase [Bacteroidia bacterium]|nr:aminopeptidase [Bacteroidia bacterium]
MRFRFARAVLTDLIFIPLFCFCIFNLPLVAYGLKMAKGELTIVWNARPVKDVLADPAVPDSVKAKLKLIEEIRQFAIDSIGLSPSKNYTTFFNQQGKRLIYVVTACRPFAMQPHLWHFPVLGDVPYKGFFEKEKAMDEENRLKKEGWDTDIGGASGWSTLGWFKDPVLSQMLAYREGDLAELIIHELTHGTIFVKDSVEYNENLASFIGYKGALWFLESKYGKDSKQYTDYVNGRKDDETLEKFMLACAHSLDSLYKSMPAGMDSLQKVSLKKNAFRKFAENSRQLPFAADTLFPKRFAKRIEKSGNTFFMQYVRYGAKQVNFENEFARFANLRAYMKWLKKKYGKE